MQKKNNTKKYLKIFAGAFLALTVLSASVMAETALPAAAVKNGEINITYTETGAGFGTFIYVFDTKVEADTTINQTLIDESLIWTGIGENGSANVVLDDAAYGVYTVVLGAKGMSAAKKDRIIYVLNKEPGIDETAAAEIAGATTAEAMAEQLAEYNYKAYMLDLSDIANQKDLIFEVVKAEGEDASLETILSSVDSAQELAEIKTADEEKLAEIIVDNKTILGVDDDIDDLKEIVATNVYEQLEGDESLAEIKTIVQNETALAAVNEAATSDIIETIEKYDAYFTGTLSNKIDDVDEYQLEKVLSDIVFNDVTKVIDIVNDEIDKLYDEEEDKPATQKPIGLGGGGGGGGGYAAPSTLDEPKVDVINDNPEVSSGLTDLGGYEWAYDAISYLYDNNIMTGDGNGSFRPGDNLTREEFVKLIITALGGGKTEAASMKFTDVEEDAWYKTYVETAFSKGIVTGISEETFGVGQNITRQDAAVMLQRAADAYYTSFAKKQTLVDFTDYKDVAEYAKVSVDILARAQIINGYEDGTFRPQGYITRAEIAKVIYACINQ